MVDSTAEPFCSNASERFHDGTGRPRGGRPEVDVTVDRRVGPTPGVAG